MDKNAIKRYAVWARRELISRVSQKALQYGIIEDEIVPADASSINGVVLSEKEKKQRIALIEKIKSEGYEQAIEEVAYTWFNRFSALRFMEVNGYLPSHVRVFTDDENNFKPQILAEAINLDIDGLDIDKVYGLKDANDTETLYKYLLIVQCNALNAILPGMFQMIDDYTELLIPDNLLREGSVIEQMISSIPEDNWKDAVQIIGWLYQYYNTDKKDEVFAALKNNVKINKNNIPAATQLFTPDWIVRYMVENSLGRIWLEGHSNDKLKAKWRYFLNETSQSAEVQANVDLLRKEYEVLTPEQIRCIDPCCGSGHICVYMFDTLVQIYESYGYSANEAALSIVENNIYGLDLDERASQMAYFAVMMKARQYDRRFFSKGMQPHISAIKESNNLDSYTIDYFCDGKMELKKSMNIIVKEFHDAREYGSILNTTQVDFSDLYDRIEEVRKDTSIFRENVLGEILPLIKCAEIMAKKYDVVITNPPYMGNKGFTSNLLNYITEHYYECKIDLFTVFIKKCSKYAKPNGIFSMVVPDSWMFLSRFEKFRVPFLNENSLATICHFGFGAFDNGFGTVAFSAYSQRYKGYKAVCKRLVDFDNKEEGFFSSSNIESNTENYYKVVGTPMCYWASDQLIDSYNNKTIKEMGSSCVGLVTGNNDRFIRNWYEVDFSLVGKNLQRDEAISSEKFKWFPINQDGNFRKWYGNLTTVFDWWHDGYNIKKFKMDRFLRGEAEKKNSKCWNEESYFKQGLTWNRISTDRFSARFSEEGCTAGTTCPIYFPNQHEYYILGLLNSKVVNNIVAFLNPTVSFQAADISRIPVSLDLSMEAEISSLVRENIEICKADWNSFETSWDFRKHPFVCGVKKIEEAYKKWEEKCQQRYFKLKRNEEEINRIFIEIYGLKEELTPQVEENDVSVKKADLQRDIKSFISYAVGCMFGRYSLDVEGISYAGGEWKNTTIARSFLPDSDGIIPVCDDEYFDDDIVRLFVEFMRTVFGDTHLEENLKYVADVLGGKGATRDVIRSYFMNKFYADHCKTYQKLPIYWMFESGKKSGFKALVYMHRYHSDTMARIRTDYIHEQQSRYRTMAEDLEQGIVHASTADRVKLNKTLKKIREQSTEIHEYEEKVHHLADRYIEIDLDNGVKINYEIFTEVLAKIK